MILEPRTNVIKFAEQVYEFALECKTTCARRTYARAQIDNLLFGLPRYGARDKYICEGQFVPGLLYKIKLNFDG